MKKIRQDNDFALLWKIRRAGVIEDLNLATDMKLVRYVGRIGSVGREVPFEMPTLGQLRIEVTPTIADRLGVYIFALEYYLPDLSAADGNQKCKADVNAFEIVSRTAEADEVTTVECETDLMIGFRGKAFESEDFTPEEWTEIQRPSVEAAALANAATQASEVQTAAVDRLAADWGEAENTRNLHEGFRNEGEGRRVVADENRDIAEGRRTQAELLRDIAEGERRIADQTRDSAERLRLQAELDRDRAELLRLQSEIDREVAETARVQADETRTTTVNQLKIDSDEAIRLTNIAKSAANTAADLAGDKAFLAQQETEKIAPVIEASEAATAFATEQGNFAKAEAEAIPAKIAEKSGPLEEKTIAQSLAELNAKVEALQALLASKMVDSIDVASELNILGKTNLILEGVGAPAIEPDFVGQRYIDTVGLVAYTAFHTASAGGWK